MYLVQVYPEGEWSPDVAYTHIVAVEVNADQSLPPGMVFHTIPMGDFLMFTYEGPESEIDTAYDGIRVWLARHGYEDNRSFDMEYWGNNYEGKQETIQIYIAI